MVPVKLAARAGRLVHLVPTSRRSRLGLTSRPQVWQAAAAFCARKCEHAACGSPKKGSGNHIPVPSEHSASALAADCEDAPATVKACHARTSIQLFSPKQEIELALDSETRKLLNAQVNDHVRQGRLDEALQTIEGFGGPKCFNVSTCRRLLAMLEECPEKAERLQKQMLEQGWEFDGGMVALEMRRLLRQGRLNEASETLRSAAQRGVDLQLRHYSHLLQALCSHDMAVEAAALIRKMSDAGLVPGEADLVQLIAACVRAETRRGDLRATHEELGKRVRGGATGREERLPSVQTILAALQARQSCVSETSATQLRAAFEQSIHSVATVTVDSDGVCSACGVALSARAMDATQRQHARDTIQEAAAAAGDVTFLDLNAFAEWVQPRGYKYVIDGPNVAYRCQNGGGGSFSFYQIDLAIKALRRASDEQSVLLILPARYAVSSYVPNRARRNSGIVRVTPEDDRLRRKWFRDGHVWVCPDRAEDDWYWMLLALIRNVRVLTMDGMRDHKLRLFQRSSHFSRWKAQQMVCYDFVYPDTPERALPTEVLLKEPPAYSIEIQQHGHRWHLPYGDDHQQGSWLCLSLNAPQGEC